ncbi:MAG: Nucleolar protein 12 [Icmadophila ericetorum]|nr:Nucleolar protein 12 [Icmadophila ericetorum]
MGTAAINSIDPTLEALFNSSLGAVKKPTPIGTQKYQKPAENGDISDRHETSDSARSSESEFSRAQYTLDNRPSTLSQKLRSSTQSPLQSLKRKRKDQDDDIEDSYMQRLAREEARDELNGKAKKTKGEDQEGNKHVEAVVGDEDDDSPEEEDDEDEDQDGGEDSSPIPVHESIKPSAEDTELEKATRTVFLGNVSTKTITSKSSKKSLLDHLVSFVPSLPEHKPAHKVESLRFRSTAYSTAAVPRKAAYIKKDVMDSTTRSTNAYAVYSTALASREAVKRLNGSIVLDRHLRVDSVAHPAQTDHRRCVFVGNLGFVDDESKIKAAEDEDSGRKIRKPKKPSDIEEGLWREFGKAGVVESVRVVRDKTTRVGKGFAYVQFQNANSVEKALLYDNKCFPPMLPRFLRVTRAKNMRKTNSQAESAKGNRRAGPSRANGNYAPKPSSQIQSLSGRANKLLGRAGAAQLRTTNRGKKEGNQAGKKETNAAIKSPEQIIFEGHRASSKQSKLGKKRGKPQNHGSKRAAAFRVAGSENRWDKSVNLEA